MWPELIIIKVSHPAGVGRVVHSHHQNTARMRWTKEENKTAICCYIKEKKESKQEYRKRMYDLWNEMGMKSNNLHAKFTAFSRTRDLQKLRVISCKKRLRGMK